MDWLQLEYQEICKSYLALRDFRAKLLGFLPLVSSGVFLLVTTQALTKPARLLPIGLYGLAVTAGLWLYEGNLRRQLNSLIKHGKFLEEKAGITGGQFAMRANPKNFGFFVQLNAAWCIYGATAVAWSVIAGIGLSSLYASSSDSARFYIKLAVLIVVGRGVIAAIAICTIGWVRKTPGTKPPEEDLT